MNERPPVRYEPPARVLVVDDEPDVLELMADVFRSDGHEVVALATLEEALEALDGEPFEAIVTDLRLGQTNGLELLRTARAIDRDAIVILVTGHASVRTAIDALRDGAYDYIQKPFDIDVLSNVLERGVGARRLVRENRRLVSDLKRANEALRRHEEELEARVEVATERLRALLETGREVTSHLDMARTLNVITDRAQRLVKGARGCFYALRESSGELTLESAAPPGDWTGRAPHAVLDGMLYDVAATGCPVRQLGTESDGFLRAVDATSALAVPLGLEGAVIGVLVVLDAQRGEFSPEDEEQLALFALQASNAVGNASVHGRLKDVERLKSDFVAMVSHEIRTPITAIKGILELMREGHTEDLEELVEIGEINARRLFSIVSDILDFSKLEASRLPMSFEATGIETVVESVVQGMKPLALDSDVSIRTSIPDGRPEILADRIRIEQVVTNLLSNAIKFSSPGDSVLITVAAEPDVVRIAVRDEGCGIADADIPKLFSKLEQLDMGAARSRGGTGLGLVISKAIVEAHGGEIRVESRKGAGSTFEVVLPVRPPEEVRRRSEVLERAQHEAGQSLA